jgi:trimeric autotransporter adhesin
MHRSTLRLVLPLLVTFIASCGGRSTLRLSIDGGDDDSGARSDTKSDGRDSADQAKTSDTLAADVADAGTPADLQIFPDVAADVATDGTRVDVGTDGRSRLDTLPGPEARDGTVIDANVDAADVGDANRRDGRSSDRGDVPTDGAAATVVSIELSPVNPTIAVGVAYTSLVVTAILSDGSTTDVTTTSTFTSSDSAVVQVSGRTLTGQKAGSATITASYSGKTATTKVTVSSAALTSISVDGSNLVSVGQYISLTATGILADGTKQDVTTAATWKSSDAGVATVALDTTSGKAKVTGVKAGSVTITATLQGVTGTATVTVTASALSRIDITPVQTILQKGGSREFQATATYADGSTSDVTLQASWSSSDTSVATVTSSSTVVVRGVATGTATITAALGSIQATAAVTVAAATLTSLAIAPSTWSPNVGGQQAFTASGTYSDGSTADVTLSVVWSSTATTIVTISNASGQNGQATALAVGAAQIQATLSEVTASASVTVSASPLTSVTVTPNPTTVVLGLTASLVATATYENGTTQDVTTQVAWSAADTSIVSVSNASDTAGQVKGLVVGKTTVTATFSGKSGTTTVTVADASLTSITVTPATASITAGKTQAFTATGSYSNGTTVDLTTQATWSSSNVSVAQVSNASASRGVATALTAGSATISATLGTVSGSAKLTVGDALLVSLIISPTTASITVGKTQTFTATAVYENGTTGNAQGGTWSSSNTATATINGQGTRTTATGVAAGSTTITFTYQSKSVSATLSVTAPTVLVQISVTPQNPASILVGATQQFQATAIYSDGSTTDITNTVSWTTSDGNIASISSTTSRDGGAPTGRNAGLATGIGAGTATITATYGGTCTVSCTATSTLIVRNPTATGLNVTPASATIRVGSTQTFTAVLIYDDGTSKTLTTGVSWTTSDGKVASITSSGGGGPTGGGSGGVATGIGAGTVKISATYGDFTATASLSVTAATPTSLVVTPATPTVIVDSSQAFVATLVYDDGTTSNVTSQASWTSSNASVASVGSTSTGGPGGGTGGSAGTATALAIGTATITATYDGLSGTATLTVTDPPISYVQVTPTNPNLPVGGTQQFTATVVFSDNTTRNVTSQATWSSGSTSIAVVTTSGANAGRASAIAEGSTTISASYNGVSGSTTLTVAKSVKSINVTPTNPTTVLGVTLPFTATATLSNDTSLVVTSSASWVTSSSTVATVTSNGTVSPVQAGSAKITATYLGVSGSSTVTVSAATLSSIQLTPNPVTLAVGASGQLTATGVYGDGTTYDLTNFATWLSSSASVASVSNASSSRGLVTGLSNGTTNVTAVFEGVTSTIDIVTVGP